jgi:hypothetical protein
LKSRRLSTGCEAIPLPVLLPASRPTLPSRWVSDPPTPPVDESVRVRRATAIAADHPSPVLISLRRPQRSTSTHSSMPSRLVDRSTSKTRAKDRSARLSPAKPPTIPPLLVERLLPSAFSTVTDTRSRRRRRSSSRSGDGEELVECERAE